MADGLLSSALGFIDRQKQAAKAGIGLLASNPQEWLTQTTARYLPTKAEEQQYRAVQQAGGDITQTPYYQKLFDLAQFQSSIKTPKVASGLLGTPEQRRLEQGYDTSDWYHGSTGDIKEFRPDLLGEATGAASAKQGFFFARDPIAPPKEMTRKSNDQEVIAMLKRAGKTDKEIEAMNTVSMKGHGADQASGYAQIGGDREYREAMRLASIAEKKGNWSEYEKQMQIAENLATSKNNQLQLLTANQNDARASMINDVANSLNMTPDEAWGRRGASSLPYSWYNDPAKIENVKKMLAGKENSKDAIKSIDKFLGLRAEILAQQSNSGANVLPIALRYKNPMVYDFKGSAYRDQTYADLVAQAKAGGHDALIMTNTFDPGAGTAKLIDVGVVFNPSQIRSKFAQFDPAKMGSTDILAAGVPVGLIGSTQVELPKNKQKKQK